MKISSLVPVVMVLVAGGHAVMAQDQSDEMMKNFYKKLTSIIRAGNLSNDLMVSLAVPGVLLDPDALDPQDQGKVTVINKLLDISPTYNPVWTDSGKRVSDIWEKIMLNKKVLHPGTLSSEQKAELDSILQKVNPNNSTYQEYDDKAVAYLTAKQAKEDEMWDRFASGKGLTATPLTIHALDKAETDWKTNGHKEEIEKALNRMTELTNIDPSAWWNRVHDKFKAAEFNGSYVVDTFPAMNTWASNDDKGWVKFSFKSSEKIKESSLSSKDASLSASLKVGGFSGNMDASFAQKMAKAMSQDNSMEISCELKRVTVQRPWVNWDVFTNANWGWSNGGPKISDGSGGGDMPMYCNAFIIARHVTFKAACIKANKEEFERDIAASVEASYGPFSLKAKYHQNDQSKKSSKKSDEGSISIEDPQIIAYISTVLPPTPLSMFPHK